LTHEVGEIERNKAAMKKNRDLICDRLDRLSGLFIYARPEGAFYVLPKFNLPISSLEFSSLLLKEALVATLPGVIFGAVGEGHVRLSFGSRYEDIEKAFDRIDAWWEQRKNG